MQDGGNEGMGDSVVSGDSASLVREATRKIVDDVEQAAKLRDTGASEFAKAQGDETGGNPARGTSGVEQVALLIHGS